MSPVNESIGLTRIAALHFFVRDLERAREHYVDALDFAEIARSSEALERQARARMSVLQAGAARFVLMTPTAETGECSRFLDKHPDGVGRIVFQVEDAARALRVLHTRGATLVTGLERGSVCGSNVSWFDITTPFGDTAFRFLQHDGETPLMPGMELLDPAAPDANRFSIDGIDHITANFLTLKPAVMWMEHVLGLQHYWDVEFHTQDVTRGASGSGLKSIVMWDPRSGIKLASNEPRAPFFESSQIYQFCEEHRGAGVQHVALSVRDIVAAVDGMRARGVSFMQAPSAYYDALPARLARCGVGRIEEDLEQLRALEVLVDGSAPGRYLLQIFMREAAALFGEPTAGPAFLELIQRRGAEGFGEGNFRALFESIEQERAA